MKDTTTRPTQKVREIGCQAGYGEYTDAQLAFQVSATGRNDADLVSMQFAARDRILKLSCEVWDLRARLAQYEAPATPLPEDPAKGLTTAIRQVIQELEALSPKGGLKYMEECFSVGLAARRRLRRALEKWK